MALQDVDPRLVVRHPVVVTGEGAFVEVKAPSQVGVSPFLLEVGRPGSLIEHGEALLASAESAGDICRAPTYLAAVGEDDLLTGNKVLNYEFGRGDLHELGDEACFEAVHVRSRPENPGSGVVKDVSQALHHPTVRLARPLPTKGNGYAVGIVKDETPLSLGDGLEVDGLPLLALIWCVMKRPPFRVAYGYPVGPVSL